MQPRITINTTHSEDPSDKYAPHTTTQYTASHAGKTDGLSDVIRHITVSTYPSGDEVTLTLTPQNENTATALRSFLTTAGLDSALDSTNSSQQKLRVSQHSKTDNTPVAVTLAMTLGKAPERIGGISENFASQIMDAELERTGVTASQAGLLQLEEKVSFPSTGVTRHKRNLHYLDADITHPLSPVTYLAEGSSTTPAGETARSTRIGFRDGKDATRIKYALEQSNVSFQAPLDKDGKDSDIYAQAAMDTVAGVLSSQRVLSSAIAGEIQAKAKSMQAEQRIGGGKPPSHGAAR